MGYCTNSISEAICHGSTDLSTRLCGKSSSLWCYWNSIDWSLILSQQYHQNVGIMVQPQFKEEFLLTYYLSYRMRTFLGVIPHSYWLGWYAEAQCSVGQSSNFLMLTSRIYGLESLCVLHRKEEQKTTWSYLGYYLWTFLLVLFPISFVCVLFWLKFDLNCRVSPFCCIKCTLRAQNGEEESFPAFKVCISSTGINGFLN